MNDNYLCWACKFCICYYKGKNRASNALKMAFCEHPLAIKENGKRHRWIVTYRDFVQDKIKTSPRWGPLKGVKI